MFKRLGLALLVAGYLKPALAEQVVIMGSGALSCGQWIESRALKNETVDGYLKQWQQGFLSGLNYAAVPESMVYLPEPTSQLFYIDDYCKTHPLAKGIEGSLTLHQELLAEKKR